MCSLGNSMNLHGKRALITGASGELGKVIALSLAELGCELLLVDHPDADLKPLQDELAALTSSWTKFVSCDLEFENDRLIMINMLKTENSKLDILINNAAFAANARLPGWMVSFEEQSLDTWRRVLEVNLTSAFHLCQAFAPELRQSPTCGSIINISSIYGIYGPDWSLYDGTHLGNPAAYGASKGGLIQLTRWLSTTLAPDVRVNSVSPGGIFRKQPQEFVDRYVKRTPLGRMASEHDIKGSVAFLASDMSRYVTGQNIVVDGGWGTW